MNDATLAMLCLLSRVPFDEELSAEARRLEIDVDWERFWALACKNATAVISHRRLRDLGITSALESPAFGAAKTFVDAAEAAAAARLPWTDKLLTAFDRAGIDLVVLKGGLFGPLVYGDASYKQMNDFDVLIHPDDAFRAAEVLRDINFVPFLKGMDLSFYVKKSHHSPPFLSRDGACIVGLHWGLCAPGARWTPDHADLWSRRVKVELGGRPAFRLPWEENLLHLCIHLPFYKTGLRELADVANVRLHAGTEFDWRRFEALTDAWRAWDPVYRVLTLARTLSPLSVPAAFMEKCRARATRLSVNDTERRAASRSLLLSTRSTHVASIEKAFCQIRIAQRYADKKRAYAAMWQLLLRPPAADVRAALVLSDSQPINRLHRLTAVVRFWRALVRDHGLMFVTFWGCKDFYKLVLARRPCQHPVIDAERAFAFAALGSVE